MEVISHIPTIEFNTIKDLHQQPIIKERFSKQRIFVLLMGPSSVGKSELIKSLNVITENRYQYVSPFMTRALREGETDKISVSDIVFDEMISMGKFVFVNPLYNVRYGTPIDTIHDAMNNNRVPILDFPLDSVNKLQSDYYDLLKIYLFPPSVQEWQRRMISVGRNKDGRYEKGLDELQCLANMHTPHPNIDMSIITRTGQIHDEAEKINYIVNSILE
jgi:guanylate kinase